MMALADSLGATAWQSDGAASQRNRVHGPNQFAAIVVLMLAVALGSFLRFSNLSGSEMSADEGASWAAARVPSLEQVVQFQPLRNPGKLAVHEILLHEWMQLFGDGLAAMRALSALAGTLGIVAVFFLTQELFSWSNAAANTGETVQEASTALAPAFAAMLFAANLVFIKYAREARMYSVALLWAVLQVGMLLRCLRRPTPVAFLLTGLFTALAIASTFTMGMLLLPEMLWLAYLVRRRGKTIYRRALLVALALMGGLVLLVPPAFIYLRVRAQAPPLLAYAWASVPPVWAPISMFNKATGSIAYPVLLGLVLLGLAGGWRREREMTVFLLLWMLAPAMLVLAASYLIRPAFVERYMLASFVPFFLLVAMGILSARGRLLKSALLALVTLLSLGHVYSYRHHAHDVQWREAVDVAIKADGHTLTVVPPYAADVVRYYLKGRQRNWSVESADTRPATVALVADSGISAAQAARIAAACPHLLVRLRGVIVRAQ